MTMEIIGLGVDLVDKKKMKKILSSKAGKDFISSTFTKKEIDYAKEDISKFASTFAVKEAVHKAFTVGWIDGKEIEVLRNKNGNPEIGLKGKIAKIAKRKKMKKIVAAISHDESSAIAVVLIT